LDQVDLFSCFYLKDNWSSNQLQVVSATVLPLNHLRSSDKGSNTQTFQSKLLNTLQDVKPMVFY